MESSKKKRTIILLVIVAALAAGLLIFYFMHGFRTGSSAGVNSDKMIFAGGNQTTAGSASNPSSAASGTTTSTSDQTTGNTGNTVDNTDLANTLTTPEDMQKVIDANKNDLNNKDVTSNLAKSYPTGLIPLYKAAEAGDSKDIITDAGNPGWTATYGSDATVDEVTSFYQSLLSSSSGYATSSSQGTSSISGTVDNCSVNITIGENNKDRTGLNYNTTVNIFIERKA